MQLDANFWQQEQDLMWQAISGIILLALFEGMEGGVDALPPELQPLVDYDVVNRDAIDFAKIYRYDKIKGITDTTAKQVGEAISDWIASGDPLKNLEQTLSPIFGSVRAHMIAVTEVTRVFAEGNASAWKSTGFVSERQWMTNQDDRVCPICAPLDGQVFPLDGDAPPAHVNCRCWMNPVVDIDAVEREAERILNG